jgi:hypothetical protein
MRIARMNRHTERSCACALNAAAPLNRVIAMTQDTPVTVIERVHAFNWAQILSKAQAQAIKLVAEPYKWSIGLHALCMDVLKENADHSLARKFLQKLEIPFIFHCCNRDDTSGLPLDMLRVVETLYTPDPNGCISPPSAGNDVVTTTNVLPVADSYIRGAEFSTSNYGAETDVRIKYSGPDTNRVGYIKWQLPSDLTLSNLKSVVASITIEGFHSTGFDGELQVRAAFHDWEETTVTWTEVRCCLSRAELFCCL